MKIGLDISMNVFVFELVNLIQSVDANQTCRHHLQ